jgi:lipopolysaccharide export system protein LptA
MRGLGAPCIAVAAAIAIGLNSGAAVAQSLSFSSKDADNPITVTAEKGLEWQQNEKRFIARGNAKAVQGDVNVVADELTAYYRDKAQAKKPAAQPAQTADAADPTDDKINSSEVYRVDAIGHVTITSASDVAVGAAAVYDFDKAVLVMEGDPVTLTTSDGIVTAHKALQYWSNEHVAVAEGDAVAADADKSLGRRLKADKITAYFRDEDAAPLSGADKGKKKSKGVNNKQKHDIKYILGQGNVLLTTKSDIVRGDRANYNVDTGIAVVDGDVKMTRDNNQLNGGYAVVNVNSGISRLYGSAAEAKAPPGSVPPARVKALLAPTPKSADAPTTTAPAPKGK